MTRYSTESADRWQAGRIALGLVMLCLGLSICGCSTQDLASADAPADRVRDATELLQQLGRRYAQCARYSDRTQLHLEYGEAAERTRETSELTVHFQRPSRLSLQIQRGINRLQLVSDGEKLWVAIEDPLTHNLQGQVVQRPAPQTLTVDEIYAATELVDPMRPQEMLSVLLGLPLDLQRSQLGLLMGSAAWQQLLKDGRGLQQLPDQAWQGQICHRLQLTSAAGDGDYLLWIDAQQGILRRLDYPTGQLFSQLPDAQRPRHLALWAEFDEVRVDGPEHSADLMPAPPATATLVQHFVLPPLALSSSKFGEVIGEFALAKLDGSAENSQAWADRIVVLAWFQDHPACRETLPNLQQVAQSFQDQRDRIVWRLVCTEPGESLSAEQLRQRIASWGVSLPLRRDLTAVGRDRLDITQAPTVVVLDGQRRLQLLEVGANPNLPQTLTLVLRRLLAGEDVAADVLRNHAAETQAYVQQLTLARLPSEGSSPADMPELPPASEPHKMHCQLRWRCDRLKSPGNLLVVDQPPSPVRLLVLDQLQDAVELDHQGALLQRHALQPTESSPMTRLRWVGSAQGPNYILGFAPLGQQLSIFDQDFNLLFRYPTAGQRHPGIMDAQLADLDADGQWELYVGFADPVGLQRVELDGTRRWSNRALPGVTSLVPRMLAKPPYLLVTDERGLIVPVSRTGCRGGGHRRWATHHSPIGRQSRPTAPTHGVLGHVLHARWTSDRHRSDARSAGGLELRAAGRHLSNPGPDSHVGPHV